MRKSYIAAILLYSASIIGLVMGQGYLVACLGSHAYVILRFTVFFLALLLIVLTSLLLFGLSFCSRQSQDKALAFDMAARYHDVAWGLVPLVIVAVLVLPTALTVFDAYMRYIR